CDSVFPLRFSRPSSVLHLRAFPTRRSSDLNGLLKWIEVHHQQVNGSNIVVPEGLQVRGVVATGKQAAVYARVQGLDPAIKNFGRSEEQRLNSSHVSISYAVFCLKKKKHKKL